MQGHHLLHHHHQQLQQQLAALLSAALPQPTSKPADGDATSASISSSSASPDEAERGADSDRVAALDSLQRAILYPPNSFLIAHSAPFLSQGLFQLLSDKSYLVRRAAAVTYGSLCAVVCSIPLTSNGRQNHVILSGGAVDRFTGWALPLIRDMGVADGSAELAFEALRQFLNVGDAKSTERYVLQILKSCQEILEDERTPLNVLHQLLGLMTLIALKYGHCFQPHFVDIVDLLLGWALVPDLSELDRRIIMESFLQFKGQWLSNLQFSLGLLSKFLGDIEVLVQDGILEVSQQSGRLFALFCCFSTVLQVTASGMLEINLQQQISEPLEGMVPQLLGCILVVGKKFVWDKWMGESWRCLVLLAEVLQEKISKHYDMVVDILFQSLRELPSSQLQGVLRNNQQVLSLQKLGLLPASVHKMMQFDMPFSQLRLHPNRSVVGSVAATYIFLLRHDCDEIVLQAMSSLTEELELLNNILTKVHNNVIGLRDAEIDILSKETSLGSSTSQKYSELELIALIKFDLSVVLSCVSLGNAGCFPDRIDIATSQYRRSSRLASFVVEKLDPFHLPVQDFLELQVHVVKMLHKLIEVEFLSRLFLSRSEETTLDVNSKPRRFEMKNEHSAIFIDHLKKYNVFIVRALGELTPLALKLEALELICTLCRAFIKIHNDSDLAYFWEPCRYVNMDSKLLSSVLGSASDREVKVRLNVASVLELLLQARLISPENFYSVAEVTLERLGDPDASVKNAFVQILCIILPLTVYVHGICEFSSRSCKNKYYLNWKLILALRKLPRQLRSQQLVSILSYISQRWKVPLASWIQRLVFSCQNVKDFSSSQQEEKEKFNVHCVSLEGQTEETILDQICPVNNLAAVWWSIHEAARHCITLRLRTNLGGPTQTFAALERMLLDIAHVLLLDSDQSEGNLNIGSSHIHLLPMRLLLDFVEALKKNVYNAYEGSSVLHPATGQSSLFFRANKKVCEEWFSRICEPMMNASLALHCHDATFYYSASRLQDLRNLMTSSFKDKPRGVATTENLHTLRAKLAGDVLKVLRNAALALSRSHEPEALVGLHNWVVLSFSSLFMEDNQLTTGQDKNSVHFSWITGLVYQAYGQYEKAAAHFSHLLQSEVALSFMGSDGIQFAIARVIESYTAVADWKSLEIWLSELQTLRAKHAGKVYSGALTAAGNEMNAVHALARFDEGDIQAAWGYLDLTPKSSSELTLDPRMGLERSEQMLLRSMLQIYQKGDKLSEEIEKAKLMLDEVLSVIPLDGLTEAAAYAMQLHCIYVFKEGSKFDDEDRPKQSLAMINSLYQVLQSSLSKVHQDCSLWFKVFRVYRTLMPGSPVTLLLCQKLMNLARKQSNFMMASRMSQYLGDHMSTCWKGEQFNLFSTNLNYDNILLDYSMGKHEEALMSLWSLIYPDMISPKGIPSESVNVLKAKALLKFSTWLREDHLIPKMGNVLRRICGDFCELSVHNTSLTSTVFRTSDDSLTPGVNWSVLHEEIVGMAVKLSCSICPHLCKSWLSYASWCYNQARDSLSSQGTVIQLCQLSSILVPEVIPDRFLLTEQEMSRMQTIITNILQKSKHMKNSGDVNDGQSGIPLHPIDEVLVKSLVQQAAYLMQTAAGAPGIEQSDGECPSNVVASQLQMLFLHANSETNKDDILSYVTELVEIWWLLRQRRVSLFGHAAHGYLQYLAHSSSKSLESQSTSSDLNFTKEKAGSCTLRATLYVLHILLNYGVELRETLEPGLTRVPLLPWQEITPQLFARLSSHPKQEVREQLEGLLIMLAKLSPWSIVYPTLVDINAFDGKPSDELCRILDCLAKLYPKLIQDVRLVISDLGAITVLWEEQWLSTLQDLHPDVMRRIHMLKEEAARIAENATLSHSEKNKINAAKYSAMMAPVVVALERRLASTSREPETSHELLFQKEYGEQLRSAILSFKTPPTSSMTLGDVWRPFDGIAASLATYQRKSSISLTEVAPRLALLRSSDVPMPGLEKQISMPEAGGGSTLDLSGLVTISSFCENMTILSTKTRPKKLVLLGSDGQKHTYLLKGREDLRLDARIMQLLQAVNSFLHLYTETCSRSLSVRYYSVTPISGRAGLIQWVDNVMSIYSVYKSWQNRVQLGQRSAVSGGNMNNTVPLVPRPSDMFYGKILPALKEKGIRRVISRRDWPHEVKRKVLLDLMKETPRQLLHKEIWCASEGFKAFSSRSKRFSGSVAAMSMMGHILGLGDRHLDNILIDFCSGDVVHIDYNVCFDKGKRLKIPEIVPFRLTQTIEAALGLTGIEGVFRANCEAVLGVLRKNKDVLLMLLEVFVWDPLVEWTRGDMHDEAAIGGEEKKGMELAVSLSLFASRFQEIRVPLQEHHDLLLATLPAAESALEKFLDVLNRYEIVSAIFFHVDQERSSLMQHETSAKSIVVEATSISEKARASFEVQVREFAQAKAVATEKAQESAKWLEYHGRTLDALRSGSVAELQSFMKLTGMEEALSLTSAVLVAGVPLTIVPEPTQAQCYDLDKEVSRIVAELDGGLSYAIKAVQEYALALQRVLPLNYISTSPVHGWAQILQLSVNNLSPDILSLARRQAADLIARAQGEGLDSIQRRHSDLFLQMEQCAMEIEKVKNECSELISSIGSDTEAKSKDRLLSAFTKYMQSAGYPRKEDEGWHSKHDGANDCKSLGDLEEKAVKVLMVLRLAANELFKEVRGKVSDISDNSGRTGWRPGDEGFLSNTHKIFHEFEEHIEKCALVVGFVNELQQLVGVDLADYITSLDDANYFSEGNWASVFQFSINCCKGLIEQMIEGVLPEVIRSVISYNTEVMEAFGSVSQIRGSVDTALEQLVEVELERASLLDLEKNYFMNVGLITEQQLALEEAAVKGRDNLSWEEAEELASQEEACRAQLDQLHQTWNQKDMHSSSLKKREGSIRNSLVSAERHLSSLTSMEEGDLHIGRSKTLLAMLVNPFSELESVDQLLSSYGTHPSYSAVSSFNIVDFVNAGYSLSESIWKFASLLNNHSFFIWKVSIVDSFFDSCVHEITSSVDRNLGFDQLYNILKKKLEIQLQGQVTQYLRERVAPALLLCLEKENETSQQLAEMKKEVSPDQVKRDLNAVKRVQHMLEEYCNAHETARAARSAVSLMRRQVTELTESLHKTVLEIVQMEWLHDFQLPYLHKSRIISQNILSDDMLSPTVLNLSRHKLLENMQSAVSSITTSLECLQACEKTSVQAEAQLERAMGWACAGPSSVGTGSSLVKNSGIPPEFHDHLLRRRQILWAAQEQASNVIKICTSVMAFEASRDGLFRIPGDTSAADSRTWQKTYMNALTRLDVTYHSFTCSEQEWKLAQNSMETAANGLLTATNELSIASVKAKSASGDLQDTLADMCDCAYEASVALSAFCRVSKEHSTLTSECGNMLEEVLAITEGLHDVYSLGKEAAALHSALMADLSKANSILIPLEASLSTDVAAMADAMSRERERRTDISPIHGQALYKSYCFTLRESCQSLRGLIPSVTYSVKELHSMLTQLARSASLHAGNLHKALEGLGESQMERSQELSLSRSELTNGLFDNKDNDLIQGSSSSDFEEFAGADRTSLQDDGWISPPDSMYSSSPSSGITLSETSPSEHGDRSEQLSIPNSEDALGSTSVSLTDTRSQENVNDKCSVLSPVEDGHCSGNSAFAATPDPSEHLQALCLSNEAESTHADQLYHLEKEISNEVKPVGSKNETMNQIKGRGGDHSYFSSCTDPGSRINRGKNPYALSVLRQVEMKLDGREIDDKRPMDIAEQVDHLLKQATSTDNLCNMYEGWTPWI